MGKGKSRPKYPEFHKKQSPVPSVQPDSPSDSPARLVATKTEASLWSGPIPPPAILQEFNKIIPDGANRIMIQFEKQAAHRQEIEKIVVGDRSRSMKRGQFLAALITFFLLLFAGYCVYKGNPWLAGIAIGIDFTSLTIAYIRGVSAQKEERRQRREEAQQPPPPAPSPHS